MKYFIHPVPDAPFWEALTNAPLKDEPEQGPAFLSFANYAEVLFQPFNVLQSWKTDQAYTVPSTPTPITEVLYFIAPFSDKTQTHRVFVGFVHGRSNDKVILCEVTILQILIRYSTVKTVSGNKYGTTNTGRIFKGEKEPLQTSLVWQQPPGYINTSETVDANGQNWLSFDFSVEWMAEGTFNKEAQTMALFTDTSNDPL